MTHTPTSLKIFKVVQLVGISVSIKTEDEKVKKVEETSLKCSHEEMDSRMLFHAKFINAPNTLVIRTVDADILVISLCNMPKLFQGLKAWLEVCLPLNNLLRYMNMNKINQSLGCSLCCALPGYYAFAGCDFTATFTRKGNIIPRHATRICSGQGGS